MTNHPNRGVHWNRETLFVLFSNLKRRFGPYAEWPWRTYPAKDVECAVFLDQFAQVVGAKSGDAVGFKILTATGVRVNVPEPYLSRIRSAAFDSGFLKPDDNAMSKPAHQCHGSIVPLLQIARRTLADEINEVLLAETPAGNQLILHP
jgi:hypothetical protein